MGCKTDREFSRFDPDGSVKHGIIFIDQNGVAKAKSPDRICDFVNMHRLDRADIARRDQEIGRRTLDQRQLRQEVIAYQSWPS
jgi:hypothetical protein